MARCPKLAPAIVLPNRNDKVAFLPPPADGGLAAAAAFVTLQRDPSALGTAAARSLAVAARWRQGGADAQSLLTATDLTDTALPPLPASTSFATLDKDGNAVACALSMDNLFGTGRILPGLGVLLRRVAGRGGSAAVFRGDRLERQYPCLPRRGRRLGPGKAHRWR